MFLNPPQIPISVLPVMSPSHVLRSNNDRTNLLRALTSLGEQSKIEVRSADSTCNPYLAFSLIMRAGLEGIEKRLILGEPSSYDDKLPSSLEEAISYAENSEFVRSILPKDMLTAIIESEKLD